MEVLEIVEQGIIDQKQWGNGRNRENFVEPNIRQNELSLENHPLNWWVATKRQSVVGAIKLRFLEDQYGSYAAIGELDVHRDFRGAGVGTMLIQYIIKLVTPMEFTRLFVNMDARNPALELFQRMGFMELNLEMRNDRDPDRAVLWRPVRGRNQPWIQRDSIKSKTPMYTWHKESYSSD